MVILMSEIKWFKLAQALKLPASALGMSKEAKEAKSH